MKMTKEEFKAEAVKRFGEDMMNWKFACPVCGNIASVEDYKKAGAPSGAVGFSCIGRWIPDSQEAFGKKPVEKGKPCNYAGGGLFGLNPIEVEGNYYFAFADVKKATKK